MHIITVTHSTFCAVGEECLQTTQDLQKQNTNNESHTAVDSTVDMDTDDHLSCDDGDGDKVSDDISLQKPERGIALKYI